MRADAAGARDRKRERALGLVARLERWWLAGGEPRLSLLDLGLIACFVSILLLGTWFAESFFTERNVSNLLRQIVWECCS